MMMMSGFVERVLNNPQRRCRSAKQVSLQMSTERQRGKSCGSQSGCKTVPNGWACDRETPHSQRMVVIVLGTDSNPVIAEIARQSSAKYVGANPC